MFYHHRESADLHAMASQVATVLLLESHEDLQAAEISSARESPCTNAQSATTSTTSTMSTESLSFQLSRGNNTRRESARHTNRRAGASPDNSIAIATKDSKSAQSKTNRRKCMISGENDVRETLITSNLDLADRLARRFSDRGESHDDLVQVASLALVAAAGRFDADRGVMFSTFATARIVGELKRHFRDRGWAVRPPRTLQELSMEIGDNVNRLSQELGRAPTVLELAEATGTAEEDVLKALKASQGYRTSTLDAHDGGKWGAVQTPGLEDSGFASVDNHAILLRATGSLSARDRFILRLRFAAELSQKEIAARTGVSQMQICRILASSLRRLRSSITEGGEA